MAKLNKKNVYVVLYSDKPISKTVGNNRTMERTENGDVICRLHGNPVVTYRAGRSGWRGMLISTCGYATVTTRAAIQDFLKALGADMVDVSLARGNLSVRYQHGGRLFEEKCGDNDANEIGFDYRSMADAA